jgi:hypothetical protein
MYGTSSLLHKFFFHEKDTTISHPINIHYVSETDSLIIIAFIEITYVFTAAILLHRQMSPHHKYQLLVLTVSDHFS